MVVVYSERLDEQLRSLTASSSSELSHNDREVSKVLRQLPWMRQNVELPALCDAYKRTVGQETIPALWQSLEQLTAHQEMAEPEGAGKEVVEEEESVSRVEVVSKKWILLLSLYVVVDKYVEEVEKVGRERASKFHLNSGGYEGSVYVIKLIRENPDCMTDYLDAKLYFIVARIYTLATYSTSPSEPLAAGETATAGESASGVDSLRDLLLLSYGVCVLRKCDMCLATLINQLVGIYINEGDYKRAKDFTSVSNFPLSLRSTPQLVRLMFNLGRISVMEMRYYEALELLQKCINKLSPDPNYGFGFKLQVYKYAIVTELLLGHIPSINLFRSTRAKPFSQKLQSYEELVLAIRNANTETFNQVVKKYNQTYQQDGTIILIHRLHHALQNIQLKKINQAYSRISLQQISQITQIQDTQNIVAKAILDKVISGYIDPETNSLVQNSLNDEIGAEAAETFSKRILFCAQMYTDAQRALQYPEEESLKARAAEAEERRRQQAEERTRAEEGDVFEDDDY